MKPIISMENLGKKYVIRHEDKNPYRSLREEIFQLPKKLFFRQKKKEEFWALNDVNFDIMPGDRVGIIGRNGAGKSTLLKLLSRIMEPTTGRITMRGRVASLLEVGTGFHPELTGRENIFLNGAILGMSRAEVHRKFDEIVDFSGVEKFLDTPVKRYSSGMYVRLAFAVAAHLEPEILVVDEVLAVGDAGFQKKCLGKMEEVSKGFGRTVLFVSHNMVAVRQLCSRGLLLESGSIVCNADIDTAVEAYMQKEIKKNHVQFVMNGITEDNFVKYMDVKMMQNGKSVGDAVDISLPLNISLDYKIKEKMSGFRIHIDLYDIYGDLIARFFNTDNDAEVLTLEKGVYKSILTIPPMTLGPTKYVMKLYSSIFNERSCVPTCEIAALIQTTYSKHWCGPYISDTFRGKILLNFPWENTRVS